MSVSVTSRYCSEMVGRIELDFGTDASFNTSYVIFEGNSAIFKNVHFPLELCRKISPRQWLYVDRRNVVINLAPQSWTLSVMNSTVAGRTKLTILATVDVRPTTLAMQYMTHSVHLCYSTTHERVAQVHLRQLVLVDFCHGYRQRQCRLQEFFSNLDMRNTL